MPWLLEASTKQAIEHAERAGFTPSAEQIDNFQAVFDTDGGTKGSRILTVADTTATIAVSGVITKSPNFLAMLFGGGNVTYPEIVSALAEADADSRVEKIVMSIDSPGGAFAGLFDALDCLSTVEKPVTTEVGSVCASAAFALASVTDRIVAKNRASRVGSIGVLATIPQAENEVTITSTEAPRKRPDVTTESGRAMVVEELDAMHALFADAIAQGRKTSVETVNATFGQGGTLLAEEALKRGMIDAVGDSTAAGDSNSTTATSGNQPETQVMDLQTFMAQHPAVYAEAVQAGIDKERDRVSAHVTLGKASGAVDTALTAIKDGTEMTATMNAEYLAAGMNKGDVSDRAADEEEAAAAADSPDTEDAQGDASMAVANAVASKFGYSEEGE